MPVHDHLSVSEVSKGESKPADCYYPTQHDRMRKTFIETSEFTDWVRACGAESRVGDHYVSSPIPRQSLERLW